MSNEIPVNARQKLRFRINQGEIDVNAAFQEEFGMDIRVTDGDSPHETANSLIWLAEWLSTNMVNPI